MPSGCARSSRSSTATTSGQIILAIAAEDRELFERRYRANVAFMNIKVIEGGPDRCDTVAAALEVIEEACDYVAIHDAARPCLSTAQVDAVFQAARAHGAALLAVRVAETIKRAAEDGHSIHLRDRAPRGAVPGSDAPGF